MKNKILIYTLLILFASYLCQAQSGLNTLKKNAQKPAIEQFEIFTDRFLYAINESMKFSLIEKSSLQFGVDFLSKVVYVELITYDGIPVVQQKYLLNNGICSGQLKIPEGIPSGNYYLKVYTRYMRNYGPSVYNYLPVTIINFLSSELISEPFKYQAEFKIDTLEYAKPGNQLLFLDKNVVNRRDNLYVSLINDTVSAYEFKSITILPDNLAFDKRIKVSSIKTEHVSDSTFIFETRGVSISGLLQDEMTREPVAFGGVNVSLLNGGAKSMAVLSDSSGRFFVSLPEIYGNMEVLVTSSSVKKVSILVDNDFCTKALKLPYLPLVISAKDKPAMKRMIQTSVIENQYLKSEKTLADSVEYSSESYYQKAFQTIVIADYIALPSLADYFYELIPSAGIREQDGRHYIQIFGSYAETQIYKPLVLIDNVIIDDIDKLMEVAPSKVNRIEIFNRPYVKGDITYGGIVNIFSNKGDMGGIDLPSSGLFFNYKMLAPQYDAKIVAPAYENEPFFANNLFWGSGLNSTDAVARFDFNVGDLSGSYKVILRGLTKNGTILYDTLSFNVK